jgi:glycerol uptake facilitator-like aquaporin
MNTRALVAEFVGTFALIFIGAGVVAIGVGGVEVRHLRKRVVFYSGELGINRIIKA